jgi:hypothetical protein
MASRDAATPRHRLDPHPTGAGLFLGGSAQWIEIDFEHDTIVLTA